MSHNQIGEQSNWGVAVLWCRVWQPTAVCTQLCVLHADNKDQVYETFIFFNGNFLFFAMFLLFSFFNFFPSFFKCFFWSFYVFIFMFFLMFYAFIFLFRKVLWYKTTDWSSSFCVWKFHKQITTIVVGIGVWVHTVWDEHTATPWDMGSSLTPQRPALLPIRGATGIPDRPCT